MKLSQLTVWAAALALTTHTAAFAQKKYDPGASDTEIKIGNTSPYSGPLSAASSGAKAMKAYFDKINDEGGINGRKIVFLSLDDGYNPPKTVEQTRKLVEQEQVLMIVQPVGTAPVSAVQKYMNAKKVPQLFVASGARKWGDPKNFPYSMGFTPDYQTEALAFAEYLLENKPDAKIAVFHQNDDLGKEYLRGLEEGLGAKAKSMIVARASYEFTDPTIDSQIIALKASGADTLLNVSLGKFASQSIRKVAELGWKPTQYLIYGSSSIGGVLTPAGTENAVGILSGSVFRDPADPQWQKGKEYEDFLVWARKYNPNADLKDWLVVWGYTVAQTAVQVIRQAGDNLTHENIMKQAASLDLTLPMLLPGVNVKTSADDYFPVERMKMMRFNGTHWELFGKVYGR
jgi:branched-chain amino acid transport system substrate-binding protein